ncbi:bZIP transcription factor 29-like [Zingiber officinale]|uniref:bZIP transcription factor 29-like n=1 Tax=Zingiber officinale TaxID=94328 RepID=UPI001C4D89EC|nr:bZIP transcription factor 29-like [Zingiber officinale]
MEERRTELTQLLHHSSASSSAVTSSSLPPSPLDPPNFTQQFRHFAPCFSLEAVDSSKRPGIPPILPSPTSSSTVALPFHSRSLSQPLGFDSLPHLATRTPPPRSLIVDSMLIDDRTPASRTPAPRDGLPPRSAHRRSHSDVAFGLPLPSHPALRPMPSPKLVDNGIAEVVRVGDRCKSEIAAVDDLIIAYMDSLDTLNSSGTEEKHEDLVECSRMSGTRTSGADSSENEAESSVNENCGDGGCSRERKEGNLRSAAGDLTPISFRHRRSFSMLQFGDESPKFPTSSGNHMGQLSRGDSMDKTMNTFNLELGNGEFNSIEMKKIMADEKLAEIALADPKKVKRILANRLSAARSKERKMHYISELEHKVHILQNDATKLSAQLIILQRDLAGLASQNNELKLRLQAMEQQAHLKNVLNEALSAEVQRLKLATGEISETPPPKNMNQQMQLSPQMFQLQSLLQQQEQKQQTPQVSPYQLPVPQQNQTNLAAKLESSKC